MVLMQREGLGYMGWNVFGVNEPDLTTAANQISSPIRRCKLAMVSFEPWAKSTPAHGASRISGPGLPAGSLSSLFCWSEWGQMFSWPGGRQNLITCIIQQPNHCSVIWRMISPGLVTAVGSVSSCNLFDQSFM